MLLALWSVALLLTLLSAELCCHVALMDDAVTLDPMPPDGLYEQASAATDSLSSLSDAQTGDEVAAGTTPRHGPPLLKRFVVPEDRKEVVSKLRKLYQEGSQQWCANTTARPPAAIVDSPDAAGKDIIAVWTHGRGYYFAEFGNMLLRVAFPGWHIVVTNDVTVHCFRERRVLSVAFVSNFMAGRDFTPPPVHIPLLFFSGEVYNYYPKSRVDLSFLSTAIPADDPDRDRKVYMPYFVVHMGSRVEDVPFSMRKHEDDIGERPCYVGYINSHCTSASASLYACIAHAACGSVTHGVVCCLVCAASCVRQCGETCCT